jgi:malate synthase
MTQHIQKANLLVSEQLATFIENDVLPGLAIEARSFWQGFSQIVESFTPKNDALLEKRATLQTKISQWYLNNDIKTNQVQYKSYLESIGYLVQPPEEFTISTTKVDEEIAHIAGPQLVVPITNARFALNAVNARWGSLNGTLSVTLKNELQTGLADISQFIGYQGSTDDPSALMFEHNRLKFEILFEANSNIAKSDTAGISDIRLESAVTTIMDCEDSVATVDAQDKVLAYKNWLGLNKGTLNANINKAGKTIERVMAKDKQYLSPTGEPVVFKSRSLMFVRNVGLLMQNSMVKTLNGDEVYEGIVDGVVTSLIGLHGIDTSSAFCNSKEKSIYIVKPKMHGPEEVAFSNDLFDRIEDLLSLPRNTLKMGIMDEERRTSVNLSACIAEAKERVVFVNTGFLDRTGDEIHTSINAGPVKKKAEIKSSKWLTAYETSNVVTAISAGFINNAQIGKGMWPIPDQMSQMYEAKIGHPKSGASCAWVPSPTAATIHSLHYHKVNVPSIQASLAKQANSDNLIDDILTLDLLETELNKSEIEREIDNNAQGILGYVVRWIDQGVGCSKVPDINDVGLMEDRATLRISSQHLANWLHHGICSKEEVTSSLIKMAKIVDQQNESDPQYVAMTDELDNSLAFRAAKALIFEAEQQPNGYTEPLLHHYRLLKKQKT